MDERTSSYLEGRFSDYYRNLDNLDTPPEKGKREWGYIPWVEQQTMIRHISLSQTGRDLKQFFIENQPRHVYYSGSTYEYPGANKMSDKNWQGADLVFDIDDDHIDEVTEKTSYKKRLQICKKHLNRLLSLLDELGFKNRQIVFSGSRGYHVHVRDEKIQSLKSEHRTELVDYIKGRGFKRSKSLIEPADQGPIYTSEMISTIGGWYRRGYKNTIAKIEELSTKDEAEARTELEQQDGIGSESSEDFYDYITNREHLVHLGGFENLKSYENSNAIEVIDKYFEQAIEKHQSEIDEPVTTDINRLIRLPSTLHGGTGLKVTSVPEENIDEFNPLVDAIPEIFKRKSINITVKEQAEVSLDNTHRSFDEGNHTVPEYIGIFLMAQGKATKNKE